MRSPHRRPLVESTSRPIRTPVTYLPLCWWRRGQGRQARRLGVSRSQSVGAKADAEKGGIDPVGVSGHGRMLSLDVAHSYVLILGANLGRLRRVVFTQLT
jgi:hypothetical protein